MAISMALLAARDEEIRLALVTPQRVDASFARLLSMPETERCLLHDRWAVIHFLCAGSADDGRPPLGLLRAGEVDVPGTSANTYAVFAETVRVWSGSLLALPDDDLRRRLDHADLLTAGTGGRAIYPGRWRGGDKGTLFVELQWYVGKLRAFLAGVADRGSGLILFRYEDL
jgi:hypothetical protein